MLRQLKKAFGVEKQEPAKEPIENDLKQSIPHRLEAIERENDLFNELWAEYNSMHGTPSDPMRVLHFLYLIDVANKAPVGDYLELGTHRGLTARLIHRLMDPDQQLYLLDTYEGFVERDLMVERKIYDSRWTEGNFLPTSPEGVAAYVGGGTASTRVHPIKGWFPDSYVGLEGKTWRFVHIDFDLYQPIRAASDIVWPQIVPGGVMIVHDYGCYGFPGAKLAVDEFADSIGQTAVPLGDRWGSAVFIKPKPATGIKRVH